MTWDAFKAIIRGDCISAIKDARVDYASETKELESHVSIAKEAFAADSSPGAYSSLAQAQRALSLHLSSSTALSERLLKARIFESGDKNGRLLANLVADPKFQTVVPTIHTAVGGEVTSNPPDILHEFKDYYASLYSSTTSQTPPDHFSYLHELTLTTLTEEDIALLEAEITVEEIKLAIRSLPSNKTPGPDGLPGDWYKTYIVDQAPCLQKLYALSLEAGCLPNSMSQAHIVLIQKPGKDASYCSAY